MRFHIFAFAAMFASDFAWAFYVSAVQAKAPMTAGLWAIALFAIGGLVTVAYTRNPWLIVSAGIGAFAGTWSAVTWNL